jgi:hypothetical protein
MKYVSKLTLKDIVDNAMANGLSKKDTNIANALGLIVRQIQHLNKNQLTVQRTYAIAIYALGYILFDGKVNNGSLDGGGNQPLSIESALAWAKILIEICKRQEGAVVLLHVTK